MKTQHLSIMICFAIGLSIAVADEPKKSPQLSREELGRRIFNDPTLLRPELAKQPATIPTPLLRRNATSDHDEASVRGFNLRQRSLLLNGDGIGPLYNALSCAACHENGGGAGVEHNVTMITLDPQAWVLEDESVNPKPIIELFPGLIRASQLQLSAIVHNYSTSATYKRFRNRLATRVPGGIDDAWFIPSERTSNAIASDPVVAGQYEGIDFFLSQRNSPPLYGLNLIDFVQYSRLIDHAELQAKQTNGQITGRVAGKFGWKGQVSSLVAMIEGACNSELGLQAPGARQAPDPTNLDNANSGVDITLDHTRQLTAYVRSLDPPKEQAYAGAKRSHVRAGEKLFVKIGCASCHVPDMRPALNIFSDLLLHDMGPRLKDPLPPVTNMTLAAIAKVKGQPTGLPLALQVSGGIGYGIQLNPTVPVPLQRETQSQQFEPFEFPTKNMVTEEHLANWEELQREWKTPPLWGVASSGPYLHDGRAETIDEAIRWHGGEADPAREQYEQLSQEDRDRVLFFLSTLQAPDPPAEED